MRPFGVVLLSAIVLLGTVLIGGGALATAQDTDLADHPLVGPWDLDTDTEDPENPLSWVTFSADGTYLQVDIDTTALGAWEPTGDATGILTFSFVDERGNMVTVRGSVEVAPDGQSLTATYTLEFVDPSGQSSGEIGPGTAEGTRIEVEGPGTPVASFEEFFEEAGGTPVAEEEFGEGVSFEFLGLGEAEELPAGPADIQLFRIGIEPGGSFPFDPEDPSVGLAVIESGAVTFRVETPITVLHPSDDGEPGPDDLEQIPAGEEFTMEEGDSALFSPNVEGRARNDGAEDASILIANIFPLEEGEEATPAT